MADNLDRGDIRAAARRLQIWGFPRIFAQRVRLNFTLPLDPHVRRPSTSAGAPVNRLGHQRRLSDPGLRVGVAPNVDTLYSVAWLDLSTGDFEVTTPDFGARYVSFQIALSDTTSPLTVGSRTHTGTLPAIVLRRGESLQSVAQDHVEVHTPGRYVMVVGRILVEPDDPTDLSRVHDLQDEIVVRLHPCDRDLPAAFPADLPLNASANEDCELAREPREREILDPQVFALALSQVLRDGDPAAVTPAVVSDVRATRILELQDPAADVEAVAAGLSDGYADIRAHVQKLGRVVNGWAINDRGPECGDDHLLRAAVAYSQIFVNPVAEAVYPVCEVDQRGRDLDGSRARYTLTFAAGDTPPAEAFWSITVYHAQGLLVANSIHRYAIGDRTPGLATNPDGSLTITVGTEPPPEGTSNWLPAPTGPFRLMLRMYCPTDLAWSPPPVVPMA